MKRLWAFAILVSVAIPAIAEEVKMAGGPWESVWKVALCCALVAFGLFSHVVTKLAELENRGTPMGLKAYIFEKPFTALSVVISAYGLLAMAYFTGEMGPIGSLSFGVAAQSVGDKFRARAQAKLDNMPNNPPGS
jgi:hypothetical protein